MREGKEKRGGTSLLASLLRTTYFPPFSTSPRHRRADKQSHLNSLSSLCTFSASTRLSPWWLTRWICRWTTLSSWTRKEAAAAEEGRPGRVEVQAVDRRGRRRIDRITFGVRETTDPHHTPGYEREAPVMEYKRKWKQREEVFHNVFLTAYRSWLALRANGLPPV